MTMGLASSDADVSKEDLDVSKCDGCFLFEIEFRPDGKVALANVEGLNKHIVDLDIIVPCDSLESVERTALQLEYDDGWLYFGFVGHGRVMVERRLPLADYRPAICMRNDTLRQWQVEVDVHRRGRKRPASADADGATKLRKLAKDLWTMRDFSDASIICGARQIPVHRNVLAAASPFFASAFKSKMKEGLQAEVTLNDADPDAVEALLAYLYTGDVGNNCDAMALLPVAHRFEVSDLVDHCASTMVSELCEENVTTVVSALRPFSDDATVKPHWNAAVAHVQTHTALVRKVMAASPQ